MDSLLRSRAEDFAKDISGLFNATVAENIQLSAVELGGGVAWVSTKEHPSKRDSNYLIPLVNSPKVSGEPSLGLKLDFKLGLEPLSKRLKVLESVIALHRLAEKSIPIARWEFERGAGVEPGFPSKRKHARQAAHLQIHGHSEAITDFHANSDAALNARLSGRIEHLHFPVGGRRFRPSIEDILEFLKAHSFVTRFHVGGALVLEESREKWLRVQLKAAIGDDVDTTVEALRELGFAIEPPRTV